MQNTLVRRQIFSMAQPLVAGVLVALLLLLMLLLLLTLGAVAAVDADGCDDGRC
jgi:hypothetical protein